jgi:hypothetical protein
MLWIGVSLILNFKYNTKILFTFIDLSFNNVISITDNNLQFNGSRFDCDDLSANVHNITIFYVCHASTLISIIGIQMSSG